MLTIAPPPVRSIAGIWYFMPRNVPRTLVAMPRSNSPGSISASGAGFGPSVALLKAASSLPYSARAASTMALAEAGSDTSVRTGNARPPAASIRAATAPRAFASRAASTTAAPAAAKASAAAAPMPLLAPATSATLPANEGAAGEGAAGEGAAGEGAAGEGAAGEGAAGECPVDEGPAGPPPALGPGCMCSLTGTSSCLSTANLRLLRLRYQMISRLWVCYPPLMGRPAAVPLGLQLARVAKSVSRAFDEALAAAGGSRPMWLVMIGIKSQDIGGHRHPGCHPHPSSERDGALRPSHQAPGSGQPADARGGADRGRRSAVPPAASCRDRL